MNRENSPDYDEYDGVIGVPFEPGERRWSASQLTAIGQCGFRWFAQRVLKLKSVDEIELGMDYTKRGTFYHKVLEIAVSKAWLREI
ncbi:MAG: PD-(D/E)XK nuclease family protein [Acidobacteria bacterium]|nr:PD-(D/E)XK nuclease family protein [Acidobacteriota bacterium]